MWAAYQVFGRVEDSDYSKLARIIPQTTQQDWMAKEALLLPQSESYRSGQLLPLLHHA